MVAIAEREPRAVCLDCRRPASVCYCRFVTRVPTRTRIVVLQHPRERDMPIGTARMATLCLPGAELHEGVRWDDATLDRILGADPARPPVLLYPGEGAIDVMESPPDGPVTLVVVDGTWSLAKKIVRENPRLARLPRYAFTPPVPSQYRIRREPKETYVSTIEALVHVLGALEGDPRRFDGLLEPFRVLIDTQIACERARHGTGSRHADKKLRPKKPHVHPLLADPSRDVVCVTGEANAWPYKAREKGKAYEDELCHWAACRLSTGETFERVVAPRHALAPRTSSYVELSPSRLEAGGTLAGLLHDWTRFIRDTDVLCFWGHYAAGLFASSGGYLPPDSVDLRAASRDLAKARVGTLEEHIERTGVEVSPMSIDGRAGRRLSQVTAIVRHMRSLVGTSGS